MIGKYTEELLRENQENFIVPAENVATLLYSHPLEHALLILSKVGYAKIPVLDTEDRLVGLIGLSDIVNKMMGLTGFDYRLLEGLTVADVMEVNVPTVLHKEDLEDILHLLVDGSFLPVVDEDNIFEGIITRKEVLKSVNHLVHELERRYTIELKSVQLKNK
ncbi:cyclic-di-AMP-binding protein CbpB [Enterococcus sp.]|uniref:cyclic-di-AMP-binding protein CbpB n=1 Tax=Enterococcus sp. TaxID=35783 RepID=UPI002FC6E0EF